MYSRKDAEAAHANKQHMRMSSTGQPPEQEQAASTDVKGKMCLARHLSLPAQQLC